MRSTSHRPPDHTSVNRSACPRTAGSVRTTRWSSAADTTRYAAVSTTASTVALPPELPIVRADRTVRCTPA